MTEVLIPEMLDPRVTEWADRIRPKLAATAVAMIDVCREVHAARQSFGSSAAEKLSELARQLGVSVATVSKWATIGGNPALTAHGHELPLSWTTLYELAKAPASKLFEAIDDGRVTRDMDRDAAHELADLLLDKRPVPPSLFDGPSTLNAADQPGSFEAAEAAMSRPTSASPADPPSAAPSGPDAVSSPAATPSGPADPPGDEASAGEVSEPESPATVTGAGDSALAQHDHGERGNFPAGNTDEDPLEVWQSLDDSHRGTLVDLVTEGSLGMMPSYAQPYLDHHLVEVVDEHDGTLWTVTPTALGERLVGRHTELINDARDALLEHGDTVLAGDDKTEEAPTPPASEVEPSPASAPEPVEVLCRDCNTRPVYRGGSHVDLDPELCLDCARAETDTAAPSHRPPAGRRRPTLDPRRGRAIAATVMELTGIAADDGLAKLLEAHAMTLDKAALTDLRYRLTLVRDELTQALLLTDVSPTTKD